MCGIFGISIDRKSTLSPRQVKSTLKDLFLFSESRGKEAAGLAVSSRDQIKVFKSAVSATTMIRSKNYADLLHHMLANISQSNCVTIIGHSRLVTTGTQYNHQNNQPVIAGRAVGIHNGIIVNHEEIWTHYPNLQRQYQVDSEVIFSLIRMFYEESGSMIEAVKKTFSQIKGTASIAALFEHCNLLLLATNNGSLYRCANSAGNAFVFASERYILSRLVRRSHVQKLLGNYHIQQIAPGQGCFVNTMDLSVKEFQLGVNSKIPITISCDDSPRRVIELDGVKESHTSLTLAQKQVGLSGPMDEQTTEYTARIKQQFPHNTAWQDSLRRCTKCILPETMPFIEFDEEGVCNYCHNYRRLDFKGADKLAEIADRYRSHSGKPDCLVSISGGRDSLYSVHYIKNVLHMNPVTYTYDWGMVTDLARRNISRICGKLGIEHILVSANIIKKRKFIKKNVSAWLKKPDLGMIPLFMAGDKQYFYYLRQVRKQLGVDLAIQGENMLERTDFKTGFAGVAPAQDKHHVYTLPLWSKIKLASYYGKEYLFNQSYINASLLNTIFASACYYMIDRSYLNLYNYIPWIEDDVVSVLLNEYDFELATDTKSTWRIGDGTAAFYNYIYYNVAGFTENETFRSNQIREGLITREEALQRVHEENKPRYETILWYLNIINMDMDIENVLEIIHAIPKLRKGRPR